MSGSSEKKQYGLIQNIKPAPGTFVPRHSIFGDDSDSDNETVQQGTSDWVKKAFQKESEKSTTKRQTKLNMQRALEEDPTIYQYDEVYDKMEETKAESQLARKDIEKKPKYIISLLAQAERRKHENERRTERQVQKEREAEGEEFKDKEAFVTAAYRAKLEEFKKQDDEEQYRERLEAFTDVSKQNDLSGFYRHLYRQTVVGEEKESRVAQDAVIEDAAVGDMSEGPEEAGVTEETNGKKREEGKEKTERLYRKRRSSSSSSSSSGSEKNLNADSVLSDSSSSDSEDESKSPAKKPKLDGEENGDQVSDKEPVQAEHSVEVKVEKENVSPIEEAKIEEEPPQIKINIWLKRTTGDLFDEAVGRYYARKASRLQGTQ